MCRITLAAPAQKMIVFFSSRGRHARYLRDWSSDVCSSDLGRLGVLAVPRRPVAAAGGGVGVGGGGDAAFVVPLRLLPRPGTGSVVVRLPRRAQADLGTR